MPGLDPHIPELDAIIEEHKNQPEIDGILRLYYAKLSHLRKAKTLCSVITERFGVSYTEQKLRSDAGRLGLSGKNGDV